MVNCFSIKNLIKDSDPSFLCSPDYGHERGSGSWCIVPDMVDEENWCEQERGNMDGPEENGNLTKI